MTPFCCLIKLEYTEYIENQSDVKLEYREYIENQSDVKLNIKNILRTSPMLNGLNTEAVAM